MIVYHGSKEIVSEPDVYHSRDRVDFGKGFYVTTIYEQAKNLCNRYKSSGENAFVSKYSLEDNLFDNADIKCMRFDTYSTEWLDFVMSCRNGQDNTDYDIVIGGVANDKVFDTVELFFQGLITKEEALGRLTYEQPNMQICIRKQEVIDSYLVFEGSEEV